VRGATRIIAGSLADSDVIRCNGCRAEIGLWLDLKDLARTERRQREVLTSLSEGLTHFLRRAVSDCGELNFWYRFLECDITFVPIKPTRRNMHGRPMSLRHICFTRDAKQRLYGLRGVSRMRLGSRRGL
jgi:hypothetical protein